MIVELKILGLSTYDVERSLLKLLDMAGNSPKGITLLEEINSKLSTIKLLEVKIMASLDELIQATGEENTVIDSVVTLLGELKTQLDIALADTGITPVQQAQIDQLFADITAKKEALALALIANTPAADAPVDEFPV